jgi:hypothetical protein
MEILFLTLNGKKYKIPQYQDLLLLIQLRILNLIYLKKLMKNQSKKLTIR